MPWVFAAYFGNIIEQLLITGFLHSLQPLLFMAIFYIFSAVFTGIWFAYSCKNGLAEKLRLFSEHKIWFSLYLGGNIVGNGTWFASVYISGLSTTAVILCFTRILIVTYAFVYMKDRFPADKAFALFVSFIAIILFSLAGKELNQSWGALLAITSCFGYATKSIASKKLMQLDACPATATFARQISHAVLFSGLALLGTDHADIFFSINGTILSGIVLTAFLGGLLVNMFSLYGLRTVNLSSHEAVMGTKPVLIAAFGILFFGEQLSQEQIVLAGIIFLSSFYFLTQKRRRLLPEQIG